ncbi:hypothetical protein [Brevundimonas balnearis]|uniref:S-layer protein C-terminal domain-containing protein n=1 Tax=Brevundimonas balnearis TaxID=1572858 RepID=A0ABV6R3W1_9CAUL
MLGDLPGDVQSNLIAGAITAVFMAALQFGRRQFWELGRYRRLWRPMSADDVAVVTSTTIRDQQPGHVRFATGAGQVKALSYLNRAFYKAFPNRAMDQVFMSEEVTDAARCKHLIVVGGPHTNALTARILKEHAAILKLSIGEKNAIVVDGERFEPEIIDGKLARDVGVIVACPNPFKAGKRAIVFFGSHTFGTEGAALFFSENHGFRKPFDQMHFLVVTRSLLGDYSVTENEVVLARALTFPGS